MLEFKIKEYEMPDHFELKKTAFEFFYADYGDREKAVSMSNIVYNVEILGCSYSNYIMEEVKRFKKKAKAGQQPNNCTDSQP